MLRFISTCTSCEKEYEETTLLCPTCSLAQERKTEPEAMQHMRADLDSKRNMVIYGPAGCGKSHVLLQFTHQLRLRERAPYFEVLCPTGSSAINVNGITWHSFFGWKTLKNSPGMLFGISITLLASLDGANIPDSLMERILNPRYGKSHRKICELESIIFDEFSMISAAQLQAMNKICQIVRGSPDPFGGIQVILFGDPFQLRPVMGEYPFSSICWDSLNLAHHELSQPDKLYRFSTALFSDMTRILRLGIVSQAVVALFKTRELIPPVKILELYYTNAKVNETNQIEYQKLTTPEHLYPSILSTSYVISKPEERKYRVDATRDHWVGGSDGLVGGSVDECIIETTHLQSPLVGGDVLAALLAQYPRLTQQLDKDLSDLRKTLGGIYGADYMCIHLKPGTRIVCTVNSRGADSRLVYANGTTGIVIECRLDRVIIQTDDGRILPIHFRDSDSRRRMTLDKDHIVDLKINFRHIPLRLGYACTFNRSQGTTLDTVRVSGKKLVKGKGMVYVGLSRCRSLESLYLDGIDFCKVSASHEAIDKFHDHFIREIRHLQAAHPEWFEDYTVNIDSAPYMQKMIRTIQENEVPIDSKYLTSSRGKAQGEFRKWLLEHQGTCLVTGEKIPELLEAAHIRPYCDGGIHSGNGILLRVDLHTLFDAKMMSFEDDGTIIYSASMRGHLNYTYKQVEFPAFVNMSHIKHHRQHIYDPLK